MTIKPTKILPLVAAALLCGACEENIRDRYTPVETSDARRTVLVEEYTGQICVNCPNGHAVLEGIETHYNTPENLEQGIGIIVVGIHIPNFGVPVENGGFVTPEAVSLTPDGTTPPQAQVNRRSGLLNRDQWQKAVEDEIAATTTLFFPTRILAEERNGVITVSGSVNARQNIPEATLHVWIVEDRIISTQFMPDGGSNDEYVHNNVYRASAFGVGGKSMTLTRNSTKEFRATVPVHPNWKVANLRAVVFVETPTDGVINAAQNHVTQPE